MSALDCNPTNSEGGSSEEIFFLEFAISTFLDVGHFDLAKTKPINTLICINLFAKTIHYFL